MSETSTPSLSELESSISVSLIGTDYKCTHISWDDVSRGTVSGKLSCVGRNITDTTLRAKDGRGLFTVRSENWNEKLGWVSTSQCALLTGNQEVGTEEENGRSSFLSGLLSSITKDTSHKVYAPPKLHNISLRQFLKNATKYGKYAGINTTDLSKDELDSKCSIRFQTVFLPVSDKDEKGKLEFCTSAYNYQTVDRSDPKNLLILCTTQGIAVQTDGKGSQNLYHHEVEEEGKITRYWLEGERSKHKVGGEQKETLAEREDALKRGKATAATLGIKAMGTRFNALMTIQVPLKQKNPDTSRGMDALLFDTGATFGATKSKRRTARRKVRNKKSGKANAARVSRGSKVDTVVRTVSTEGGKLTRHPDEHITITVVMYNTITGGVPSEEDVKAAIEDLDALYDACNGKGKLADAEFDFMKKELTVGDLEKIQHKVLTQPNPNVKEEPKNTSKKT